MANILVTGGAGFIGANFVHHWTAHHPDDQVVVLDVLTYSGNAENLKDSPADLVVGDICDQPLVERLLQERSIDTLVHFAAESHVDRSIHGPDAFIEANIIGTHNLLKAAKNVWLDQGSGQEHRFHHISTDEVYGSLGLDDPAFSEATQYAPNSPYSASKAASDHLVRAYHHTYGLEVTTTNCSNNYGPYQFPEKLIPLFLINCLTGKPLPIYGDGMQRRDWLHVEDHCRGIEAAMLRGKPGETYNIGGGAEKPNVEVIDTLCAIVDSLFETTPELANRFPDAPATQGKPSTSLKTTVTDRPGHDRRYAIDEAKARAELNYEAKWGFKDGLDATVRWYLDNEAWWRGIMDGTYRNWVERNYEKR